MREIIKIPQVYIGIATLLADLGLQMIFPESKYFGCLLIAISVVFFFIAYNIYKRDKIIAKNNETKKQEYNTNIDIIKITQQRPANRLPRYYSIIQIITAVLMLAFGIFSIVQWIRGELQPDLTNVCSILQWLLFYIVFIAFPFFIIWNICIREQKHIKSGESCTVKRGIVFVEADNINDVSNRCLLILKQMGAGVPYNMDLKHIEIPIKAYIMAIDIKHIRGRKYKIFVKSDAYRVEIMVGKKENQNNVDEFIRLMDA